MVITRDQYQRIAADVEAALAPVGEAHGLELRLTNGKYGDRFQVLVQGLVASEPGAAFNPNAPEAQAYIRNAEVYGLPADGLGRTVTLNGREFVIVGLNPRAPKLPVLAVSNGQTYKLRVGSVLAGLPK